jgi:hypothetical protein
MIRMVLSAVTAATISLGLAGSASAMDLDHACGLKGDFKARACFYQCKGDAWKGKLARYGTLSNCRIHWAAEMSEQSRLEVALRRKAGLARANK